MLKWGIDFRRLTTEGQLPLNYELAGFFSADDVLNNTPGYFIVNREARSTMKPVYINFSAFFQDEWKVSPRLNLSLGLRWELNPAPHDANGIGSYTITTTDLATTALAPAGTSLWKTTYANFAPRFGFAYQVHQKPGYETVLRAGGGLFYDLGNAQASIGYWFGQGWTGTTDFSGSPLPLSADQIQNLPPPSTDPPYNTEVVGFDPHLKLPRSWQWNVAVQQSLGQRQTFTLSYVGSVGQKLLIQKQYDPTLFGNPNFVPVSYGGSGLYLTTNGASSSLQSFEPADLRCN